jgi:2-oxoglutarate/2-oxoacid ferredoxin oxidoreductase subunit beta
VIVHDNQIYGLTKGQASPTSEKGYVTKVQRRGVTIEPMRPLRLAIALGCGFVARGFSGDADHLADLIVQAVGHKGFSLIDVLQPCVSFNKLNTHAWYKERVYALGKNTGHDPSDISAAFIKAGEWGDSIPIGVLYRNPKPCFEEATGLASLKPLVEYEPEESPFEEMLKRFV